MRGRNIEPQRLVVEFDRPAGQDAGERRDVRLGVPGGGTDRVQFHALAREVLIQAAVRVQSGDAVRPDRAGVVEVHQHRRVPHDRQQHVRERPRHVRPDRLRHERACEPGALAAPCRDGKMVGPEPDQPLPERGFGHNGSPHRRETLRLVQRACLGLPGNGVAGFSCVPIGTDRGETLGRGGHRTETG